jgi:uncharacterized protein YecE (DUF72 family)
MDLYVGASSERGSIKKFDLDVLEMPVTDSMPKSRTLREMRATRPDLKFSLRLHPDVAQAGAMHADLARARDAAEALGASVIVVPTGPRFTPTKRYEQQLGDIADKVRIDGIHVAWEPRGVWTPEESEALATAHQMLLVRDLTRLAAPKGPVVYTRLLPLGMGARLGQTSLEQLAAHLQDAKTAFVIVQAEGAKRARTALREWFDLEQS